jgi:hypothetical protein
MNREQHTKRSNPRERVSQAELHLADLFGVQVRNRKILTRKTCSKAAQAIAEIADLLEAAARTGRPVKLPAKF